MKKATTIEKQIQLLKERGMVIQDEEKAREVLLDIGFYRLGFYSFPFEKTFPSLKNRDHRLQEGTSFEDVLSLYYFDSDLRYILTAYLNRIEVNLRTYLTYTVSNYYSNSPTWFADPTIVQKAYAKEFEEKVYHILRGNPVIKRHCKKYGKKDFAPAWKTVEFMTLGSVCMLFHNLQSEELRVEIAEHYRCSLGVFENYLQTIRQVRNTCAHGACLFNTSLPKSIKAGPLTITEEERHNICGIIRVICYVLGQISNNRKQEMVDRINKLLQEPRSEAVKAVLQKCSNLSIDFLNNLK